MAEQHLLVHCHSIQVQLLPFLDSQFWGLFPVIALMAVHFPLRESQGGGICTWERYSVPLYIPGWSLRGEEEELRPLHGHRICSKAENVVTQQIQTRVPHTEIWRESNEAIGVRYRKASWTACAQEHLPSGTQNTHLSSRCKQNTGSRGSNSSVLKVLPALILGCPLGLEQMCESSPTK